MVIFGYKNIRLETDTTSFDISLQQTSFENIERIGEIAENKLGYTIPFPHTTILQQTTLNLMFLKTFKVRSRVGSLMLTKDF